MSVNLHRATFAALLGALLLLPAPRAAGEKILASFRMRKAPRVVLRGWILSADDQEFLYERFGDGGRRTIRWRDVVEEDSHALRKRLRLELTEDEKKGLVPGHQIRFEGGTTVRGLLVDDRPAGDKVYLRHRGFLLAYPKDRIVEVLEVKVPGTEIYTKEELYVRRFERTPPRTATQHRELADYLYEVGNFEKAAEHYGTAIELRPRWRDELRERLDEVRELMRDDRILAVVRRARAEAFVRGNFEEAIGALRTWLASNVDGKRIVLATLLRIEERWYERRAAHFRFVKHEEFDRTVDRFLRAEDPDLRKAMSWAKSRLPEILRERIRERLQIDAKELESFLEESRERGALHHAGYAGGSFVVSSRAKKGKTTGRHIRGDPDAWWTRYNVVSTRKSWLKAYAAERLADIFQVVRVRHRDCPSCGATGTVGRSSVHPIEGLGGGGGNHAGHEWKQLCARCYGAVQDRSVSYR